MIDPNDRFWISSETIGGDTKDCTIIDWDRRKCFSVHGPETLLPPDEGVEIEVLKRHIDHLSHSIHSITVNEDGLLKSISSKPEDDATLIFPYARLSESPSLQDCRTIRFSQLRELDRLGPEVDLVSYVDEAGVTNDVVFKYSMVFQRRLWTWRELHIAKAIPSHPGLVPFDRVVVTDDAEARVLGFTVPYIPGGTLDRDSGHVFRLKWLQQLLDVVDFLNLELGIAHQDVAPRNLVIDPETEGLRLFDFDRAAKMDSQAHDEGRNDVKGVVFTVYEILTRDEHFRSVEHLQQDEHVVLELAEWPVNRRLDCEVGLFRQCLKEWVQRRRNGVASAAEPGKTDTKTFIVPPMPPPSPMITGRNEQGEPIIEALNVYRRSDVLPFNKDLVMWERPPQHRVKVEPEDVERREISSPALLSFNNERYSSRENIRISFDRLCLGTG